MALEGALLLGAITFDRVVSLKLTPSLRTRRARHMPSTSRSARGSVRRSTPLVRWEGALVLMLIGVLVLGSPLSTAFWKSDNVFYIGLNIGEIAIMACRSR